MQENDVGYPAGIQLQEAIMQFALRLGHKGHTCRDGKQRNACKKGSHAPSGHILRNTGAHQQTLNVRCKKLSRRCSLAHQRRITLFGPKGVEWLGSRSRIIITSSFTGLALARLQYVW